MKKQTMSKWGARRKELRKNPMYRENETIHNRYLLNNWKARSNRFDALNRRTPNWSQNEIEGVFYAELHRLLKERK